MSRSAVRKEIARSYLKESLAHQLNVTTSDTAVNLRFDET